MKTEIEYEIPGNENYLFLPESLTLKSKIDEHPNIEIKNDVVIIALYNHIYNLDLNWFTLYCRYGITLPFGYAHEVLNVKFVDYNLKSHGVNNEHLALFKKPVAYKKDPSFRLLAMYTDVAVNNRGDIVNVVTGRIYPYKLGTNYHNVLLRCPYVGHVVSVRRHRLVAMAWVDNDDYVARPIVDHKDGNKSNCNADNLEWVSFRINNVRAAEVGLKSDNLDVIVKDYTTGDTSIFGSMTQACKFMGRSRIDRLEEFCNAPKLINGRYQIKLLRDTSAWDFLDDTNYIKVKIDGVVSKYHNLKALLANLDPSYSAKNGWTKAKARLQRIYPDIEIQLPPDTYKRNKDGYQALEITTGKIVEANERSEFIKLTGLSKSSIAKGLKLGETYSISGYSFRVKSDTEWPTIVKHLKAKHMRLTLMDSNGLVSRVFDSMRAAANFLGVDKKTLKVTIGNRRPIRGYLISKEVITT